MKDGTIVRHLLHATDDVWTEEERLEKEERSDPQLEEFLRELGSLEVGSWDFRECIHRYVQDNELKPGTKQAIMKALGE